VKKNDENLSYNCAANHIEPRVPGAVTCSENKEKKLKRRHFLSAMLKKPTWTRIVYKQKSIA